MLGHLPPSIIPPTTHTAQHAVVRIIRKLLADVTTCISIHLGHSCVNTADCEYFKAEWVPSSEELPQCLPARILEVYQEDAFLLEQTNPDITRSADDVTKSAGDVTNQLVTGYGRESAYCLDYGIEDGSYLRLVALACLDPQLLCRAGSCLNTCCSEHVYCQLPQLLTSDYVARPKRLDCVELVGANVTVLDKVGGDGGVCLKKNICLHADKAALFLNDFFRMLIRKRI
jgi:hypothetical protein